MPCACCRTDTGAFLDDVLTQSQRQRHALTGTVYAFGPGTCVSGLGGADHPASV